MGLASVPVGPLLPYGPYVHLWEDLIDSVDRESAPNVALTREIETMVDHRRARVFSVHGGLRRRRRRRRRRVRRSDPRMRRECTVIRIYFGGG